jgi:protein TonB
MPSPSVIETVEIAETSAVRSGDTRPATASRRQTPGANLRIETLDQALPRRSRSSTAVVSASLHVGALLLVVVVPLLTSSSLPEPTAHVKAFLVEPSSLTPPPPPPPPPAPPAAAPRPATQAPAKTPELVAPIDVPANAPIEDGLDVGVDGGLPGGVEGGVEGGVVGGIIGGLPEGPPPPAAPVRVGGAIKEPKKLKHVPPEYPELARQSRVQGVVIVEARLSPDGRVQEVKVLRGVPLLDHAALQAVRQWVYTPTLVDGVPVPVVMTVTVHFNILDRR